MKNLSTTLLLAGLFITTSCSSVQTERAPSSVVQFNTWPDYLLKEVMSKKFISDSFTDPGYLNPTWRDSGFIEPDANLPKPSSIKLKTVQCEKGEQLYPAHPYALSKAYHAGWYTDYMMSVPAASSACKIENTTHKYCLRPDGAHVVLMSDTYIDACGKTYRGVWVVPFMHSEDNMGTLLGKGRIIINRPGTSSYDKDYISGDTYAVKASDFLFLTETFPGDDASIAKYRQQALTKEYYLMSDYTFKRK